MTYRLNSDLVQSRYFLKDIKRGLIVAPSLGPKWKAFNENFKDEKLMEIIKKKTKDIAADYGDCSEGIKRNYLVKKVQKAMSLDVYGSCGTNK